MVKLNPSGYVVTHAETTYAYIKSGIINAKLNQLTTAARNPKDNTIFIPTIAGSSFELIILFMPIILVFEKYFYFEFG
jgi:hypothetical protein